MVKIREMRKRIYKCRDCGFETEHQTNHIETTISNGRYSVCPKCPPYKKYPEFGGMTSWECMEKWNLKDLDTGELFNNGETYTEKEIYKMNEAGKIENRFDMVLAEV